MTNEVPAIEMVSHDDIQLLRIDCYAYLFKLSKERTAPSNQKDFHLQIPFDRSVSPEIVRAGLRHQFEGLIDIIIKNYCFGGRDDE